MTDDAPQVVMWEWQPVTTDSGDILLTPNDITSSILSATTVTVANQSPITPTTKKSKTAYFYNQPGMKTGCLF
jgi:hypothetical protein